jgi:hypothetical protein
MPTKLSNDPADLFVELYDRLGDEPFTGVVPAEGWYFENAVLAQVESVREAVLATGMVEDLLLERLDAGDQRSIFACLLGLDQALDHINPFSGSLDGHSLYRIARRHAATGHLNSDPKSGALLFGCTFAGRPAGIPVKAEFFGLVRVAATAWQHVDHDWIPNEFDIAIDPTLRPGARLAVGCVPMIDSYDEMTIQKTRRGLRRPAYRVGPRVDSLPGRVDAVLAELERSEATIGLLPEATLDDGLLEVWRAALAGTDPPDDSQLTWIVAGTGPVGGGDPPHNRAVLLHRSGQVLFAQDKLNDFTLTSLQLHRWNLNKQLGSVRSLEDISKGERVEIRESNLGRIAILICEDLTRTPTLAALTSCGVSHVFVPIFSPPVDEGWVKDAASRHVADVGAWIIVATSLAVGREMDKAVDGPLATCRSFGPQDAERDEWHFDDKVELANLPTDVALLWISTAMVHRFTDFT